MALPGRGKICALPFSPGLGERTVMALFKKIEKFFRKSVPVDKGAGKLNDYQVRLLNRMRDLPPQKSPKGWELSLQKFVGGLRYLGFSEVQPGKILVISCTFIKGSSDMIYSPSLKHNT